jgi:hypothetical protein
MPYVPRAAVAASCAHCGVSFDARHLRRKYCCNSCNVLAARARKKAATLAAAAAAPPTGCALPTRYHERVAPFRAMAAPRLMDLIEYNVFRVGADYWIQGHGSDGPVNWLATRRGEVYRTRAFWVSASGKVWVRGANRKFIEVDDILPEGTSVHSSRWGPFLGEDLPFGGTTNKRQRRFPAPLPAQVHPLEDRFMGTLAPPSLLRRLFRGQRSVGFGAGREVGRQGLLQHVPDGFVGPEGILLQALERGCGQCVGKSHFGFLLRFRRR